MRPSFALVLLRRHIVDDESCSLCTRTSVSLGASGSPGVAYCVTGEIIVRDVLDDGSTCATKSTPIPVGRLPQRHRTLRKVQ